MSEEVKNTDYVLEVENLHTCFHTESGDVNAVNGLSMTLEAGKTLGIVGESGSGKSDNRIFYHADFSRDRRDYGRFREI